jgi:hypothetical protein
MSQSSCGTCKFAFRYGEMADGKERQRHACRRNPPQTHFIIVPVHNALMGGMQPQEQQRSSFPPVQPDWWCGEHQPLMALAQ